MSSHLPKNQTSDRSIQSIHVCVPSTPSFPAQRPHTYENVLASTQATANAAEGASDAVPATRPSRQNSLSAETLQALEKRLAQRPDRQELQERNILKGASGPGRFSADPRVLNVRLCRGERCPSAAGCARAIAKVTTRGTRHDTAGKGWITEWVMCFTRTSWIRNFCTGPSQRSS